jgi:translation initiation factor 2 beta subunit (eIF-2beta)/eIF-5
MAHRVFTRSLGFAKIARNKSLLLLSGRFTRTDYVYRLRQSIKAYSTIFKIFSLKISIILNISYTS